MIRTVHAALLFISLLVSPLPAEQAKPKGDAEPLKIHIISGSREYKSEPSLKAFKEELEKAYRVHVTASWGHDGIKELENLDKLADADLMLVFARRMKLGDEQMAIIRRHWEQGKPIVGVRTSSHAFQKEDNEIFDRKVMGGDYKGHYGNEPVKVINVAEDHPVLQGVEPFVSRRLYKAGDLAKDATVLQQGDIGKARHAVTWTHNYKGGRTFYTSLGVPEDFEKPSFKRMLVNAIFWTAKRDAEKLKR